MSDKHIYIPAELRPAATDNTVVNSDYVTHYNEEYSQKKTQRQINNEFAEAQERYDTEVANIIQYNNDTIAAINALTGTVDQEVLTNEQRLNLHATALEKIATQLNSTFNEAAGSSGIYTEGMFFRVVEEEEMEEMIDNNTADPNTFYFQLEPTS